MNNPKSHRRMVVLSVLGLAAGGLAWLVLRESPSNAPLQVELLGPEQETSVKPLKATNVEVAIRSPAGASMAPNGSTVPVGANFQVTARFRLNTDREKLPPAVVMIYKTKPSGKKTIMQTAVSESIERVDDNVWQAVFDVGKLRDLGSFTMNIHGVSNGLPYDIVEQPITIVK